jgi:hypothetical protein
LGSLGCPGKVTLSQQRGASLVLTLRSIQLLNRRLDNRRNNGRV